MINMSLLKLELSVSKCSSAKEFYSIVFEFDTDTLNVNTREEADIFYFNLFDVLKRKEKYDILKEVLLVNEDDLPENADDHEIKKMCNKYYLNLDRKSKFYTYVKTLD